MKPLTVGNVVSAGLRIYHDRFSDYYQLAFVGCLWVLVPIYGWAKYAAMMGLISRLAFREVTEKPESIRDAKRFVNPRMYSFFGAGILVSLISIFAMIVFAIIFGGVIAIFSNVSGISITIRIISILIALLLFIFSITWLASRLLIFEAPLAIEEDVNALDAISRSWKLTKGYIFRLQLIIFVGFLISLPISIATYLIQLFMFSGSNASFSPELFGIISSAFGASVLIPFWQSLKAVIYYDLRVRKEGLGLNLERS